MFVHRIETEGLAHWSYYLEDANEAIVIDPRRDIALYADLARSRGAMIVTVLETHRNEDYVVGTSELAARTGASAYHADEHLDYEYGTAATDGQRFRFGSYELEALHTPGHTPGHVSYLLRDGETPWMLFSGDLLFAGEVGRVDLGPPGSAEQFARDLHRTLSERVLPLGEHVVVWPAHGAGSACGSSIASRPYTTIGMELALNPLLGLDENDFAKRVSGISTSTGQPPYFRRMEEMNLTGSGYDERLMLSRLTAEQVEELVNGGALVIDTRDIECFLTAHVPDALALPSTMIGRWAGWFVDPDAALVLVSENPERDATQLLRMGFDSVHGYLGGGMKTWETSGRVASRTHILDTPGVCHRLDEGAVLRVLDVRSAEEVEELGIEGALNVPMAELPGRLEELTDEDPIVIFCGTGRRSTIAASILERAGRHAEVVLGGTTGWSSGRCPLRGVVSA